MSKAQGIWVYAETDENGPLPVVFELLAKARELAGRRGQTVTAVLLGPAPAPAAEDLSAQGADRVIHALSPVLAGYSPRPYAEALEQLSRRHRPDIFLFGATAQGRDLAPRLQGRLQSGLTADCLDLDLDENGLLVQIKPAYGGNIMCKIICPEARPQMATVRPRVFTPLARTDAARAEIVVENLVLKNDENYRLIEHSPRPPAGADLSAADCLVAIGRGAQSERAVQAARDLAGALGGALAVTRPLTENNLFSHDLLIGQSGQTVKAKCLINFGISGAIQYAVGIREAGLIISVNRDKDAPVFNYSHYAIVADAEETLEALLKEIVRRRQPL
jgi:electron transfer flavoprotein alpha subunit